MLCFRCGSRGWFQIHFRAMPCTSLTGALFAYAQPTRACLAMKDLLSQQLEHMERCIPPADLK